MFITEHQRQSKTASLAPERYVMQLIAQGFDIRTTSGFRVRSELDLCVHDPTTMYIHNPAQTRNIRKQARTGADQPCPKCEKEGTFKAVKIHGDTPAMFCESCRHVDYATAFQGSDDTEIPGKRYTVQVGDNAGVVTLQAVQE